MLTHEDNELLCRVGPGTAMGTYMRQFWIPALRSSFLKPDEAPERVKLLGESFVAFRDTAGRVGFMAEACPHRGVSLSLARNEDHGIRCLYHGWKFTADGKAVDIPTERPEARAKFAERIPVRSYPTREAGHLIWVYLGGGEAPEFPYFNWLDLPENQVHAAYAIVNFNWLTGLESQLDSSHVGVLHKDLAPDPASNVDKMIHDAAPRFEFETTAYGYREAAIRNMAEGTIYVRLRDVVLPWYSFIPMGARDVTQVVTISVPVDDEHSAQWDINYNFIRPLRREEMFKEEVDRPDNYMWDIGTIENRFHQDRKAMKNGHWTGFDGVRPEDFAVNMSQKAIPDRTREFLSTSDASIVRARRALLDNVRRSLQRSPASPKENIKWDAIQGIGAVIAANADWRKLKP